MPTASKSRKAEPEARWGTKSYAIGITMESYEKKLRPMVNLHKTSVKKFTEALIDYVFSLPADRQGAVLRGEVDGKKA